MEWNRNTELYNPHQLAILDYHSLSRDSLRSDLCEQDRRVIFLNGVNVYNLSKRHTHALSLLVVEFISAKRITAFSHLAKHFLTCFRLFIQVMITLVSTKT